MPTHPAGHGARPSRRLLAPLTAALVLALALLTSAGPAAADPGHLPSWWYDAMHLAQVHRQSTGTGVTVAVIDRAVDPSAADIRGTRLTLAQDCQGHRVRPAGPEVGDHGSAMVTNLAGTGHGNGPGGRGVLGIAPGVDVRFYGMDTNPSTAFPDDCDFFNAAYLFRTAVADGADIISVSLELGPTPQLKAAIRHALDQGVVVVAAAGIRGPADQYDGLAYPAEQAGVVAVNAVGRDSRPYRENPRPLDLPGKKEFPVISAPGVKLDSSGYEAGRGWVSGGTRTGTSDAAPLVAGALALVKSKYPDATGNQLVQQLIHYTTTAGKYYWDEDYGFGIVSAQRMLAHDPTGWPDANPLLQGPKQAVARYPMSSYGRAGASAASASASPAAATNGSGSSHHSTTAADDPADHAGVPVWVWAVVVLLVVGALVLVAARTVSGRSTRTPRGSRLGAADDNTKEV